MTLAALFTGASGLQANSTALDVVGNNLANLNTTGYKTQRTLFRDQVYQLIDAGSAGNNSAVGGTNSAQLGDGVDVGAVDTQFTQGTVTPTGQPYDAAISGRGFFVLRSATGQVYSRDGNFNVDASGYLVDPASGNRVQRTGPLGETTATQPGFQVSGNNDIRIPIGAGTPGTPTATATLSGNIGTIQDSNNNPKQLAVGDSVPVPISFFDTQGGPQALTVTLTKTADNTFSVSAALTSGTGTATVPPTSVTFDTNGILVSPATLPISVSGIPGAGAQTINLNLGTPGTASGLTQFPRASTTITDTVDGGGAGSLQSASIDANGIVQGQFSNGRTIPLAQIAVATFNNQGGLLRSGANSFTTGPGSGDPSVGSPNSGGRGAVTGGSLEGSGVDIAVEFSRLIIAQRGFQVNARTITAANDTLQELANIIR